MGSLGIGFIFLLGSLLFCLRKAGSETNGTLLIDQFGGSQGNGESIPIGWQLKVWKGKPQIELKREGEDYALKLMSQRSSFGLYKDIHFDLPKYPILKWRWKVTLLPKNGDVRFRHFDDQAAGIYIIFPKFPAFVNSRIVAYTWENLAPQGKDIVSPKFGNARYVILRSGPTELGKWVWEERNVYEDYKRLFQEEPPSVGKVALMIDSDDTQSSAESFFDDIVFLKRKEER
ncbi:MAG: DUF3047 domain-containing protein [Candidatus Tectomicrobia bacterium]|uniref:DUF3047 domain-containing protein n=1 Tax=Tectimicrobiota bacterium TaxID=2528274 RepID=A0A932FXF3_UNCTE|nr:DUF3047 domain-containing protein [Candidatus Tectomicrobia bacterium]